MLVLGGARWADFGDGWSIASLPVSVLLKRRFAGARLLTLAVRR